jgi:hypothetical protein
MSWRIGRAGRRLLRSEYTCGQPVEIQSMINENKIPTKMIKFLMK